MALASTSCKVTTDQLLYNDTTLTDLGYLEKVVLTSSHLVTCAMVVVTLLATWVRGGRSGRTSDPFHNGERTRIGLTSSTNTGPSRSWKVDLKWFPIEDGMGDAPLSLTQAVAVCVVSCVHYLMFLISADTTLICIVSETFCVVLFLTLLFIERQVLAPGQPSHLESVQESPQQCQTKTHHYGGHTSREAQQQVNGATKTDIDLYTCDDHVSCRMQENEVEMFGHNTWAYKWLGLSNIGCLVLQLVLVNFLATVAAILERANTVCSLSIVVVIQRYGTFNMIGPARIVSSAVAAPASYRLLQIYRHRKFDPTSHDLFHPEVHYNGRLKSRPWLCYSVLTLLVVYCVQSFMLEAALFYLEFPSMQGRVYLSVVETAVYFTETCIIVIMSSLAHLSTRTSGYITSGVSTQKVLV